MYFLKKYQTRADISFKEPQRGGTKEIVHITDDTGGHPLSPSHFERGRERTDPTHTLTSLDQAKAVKYREYLEKALLCLSDYHCS